MSKTSWSSANIAMRVGTFGAIALSITSAAAVAASAPPIYVNGARVPVPAIERGARVFVPIRGVFERLGAAVIYANGKNIVVRKQNADVARVTIGSRSAMIRGGSATLDTPPFRSRGHVFVPLRFISEGAGAVVAYATSPRAVKITDARPTHPVAAVVVPAAATAAPVDQRDFPWWVWLLLAAIILLPLLFFLRSRRAEPVIITRSVPRARDLE